MAKIPQQNPMSSEIRSPLIAGVIEGLNKISSILEMGTTEYENAPLEEVFISDKDRYRIYQVAEDKRLWLTFPNAIIRKNGNIITPTNDFFTIDYIGGSIAFEEQYRLIDTDKITATFTSVSSTSDTINGILQDITDLQTKANHDKGFFETITALETAHPTAIDGDNAIVGETDSLWVWDKETNKWKNSFTKTDLSNYYTKQQADNLLGQKEPIIVAKGETTSDDNFYYGGTKKWIDLLYKIRNTTLANLDTSNSEVITEIDNVLSAFGKIQGQLNNKVDKVNGKGLSENDFTTDLKNKYDGYSTSKENAFTKNTAFNKNFGTTSGTVCQGNDSRLNEIANKADKSNISDIVLISNNWQGDKVPFTYKYLNVKITKTSCQEILPSATITKEELSALQSANLTDAGQDIGYILLQANGEKPKINIPIRIIFRGDM